MPMGGAPACSASFGWNCEVGYEQAGAWRRMGKGMMKK